MKLRSSLYAKLLLWLLLDLLLIGALFFAFPGRSGMGWNMLLSEPVRERLLTIGERIGKDLSLTPEAGWEQVLEAYNAEYGVTFSIEQRDAPPPFRQPPDGRDPHDAPGANGGGLGLQDGVPSFVPRDGPAPPMPADRPPPEGTTPPESPPGPPPSYRDDRGFGFHGGPGKGFGAAGVLNHAGLPPFANRRMRGNLIAINHPHSFDPYDVRIPATVERSAEPSRPVILTAHAAGLGKLLRFLGVTEWLLFAALVIGLSALLWWPFVWGITRTVVRVTDATEHIAAGRFETRIGTRRSDELGRLADSVNRMAERLQSYVTGQKQFLADVAHEVTSPLARMQMGLGILESRVGDDAQRTLQDVQEEAEQMSRLLNELLLFSRAGMEAERAPAVALDLYPLLRQVLQREDPQQRVRVDGADGLRTVARAALLERAIANLVRNALRYAGDSDVPVELTVARDKGFVHILVRDRGPGVPPEALARLGEPFYRPEVSRDRDSGGTGLGLAIVMRCIEACGGSVVLRNREGGGFEAEVRLAAAD
ncbi:MAG: sensor histidine kinase [Nevskia sp.]|nr:sensor histidine kinase [Nevskia sp.]